MFDFVFLCVRVVDAHDDGVANDLGSENRDGDYDDEDDEDDVYGEDQDYKPVFKLMHILPPKSKPLPELLKIIRKSRIRKRRHLMIVMVIIMMIIMMIILPPA